jgi:hypothetical protein
MTKGVRGVLRTPMWLVAVNDHSNYNEIVMWDRSRSVSVEGVSDGMDDDTISQAIFNGQV